MTRIIANVLQKRKSRDKYGSHRADWRPVHRVLGFEARTRLRRPGQPSSCRIVRGMARVDHMETSDYHSAHMELTGHYTLVQYAPKAEDYLRLRRESGLSPKSAVQAEGALVGSWAYPC